VGAPKGYILLTLRVRGERGRWVADCSELGTASCGDTVEQAVDNVKDACIVHLNALEQLGERKKFFREHNIRIQHVPLRAPRKVDIEPGVLTTVHMVPA